MANTWITDGDNRSKPYGLHMVYIMVLQYWCQMANTWITDGNSTSKPYDSHMVYICSCNIDAIWLTHGSQMVTTDLDYMACIWCTHVPAILMSDG